MQSYTRDELVTALVAFNYMFPQASWLQSEVHQPLHDREASMKSDWAATNGKPSALT